MGKTVVSVAGLGLALFALRVVSYVRPEIAILLLSLSMLVILAVLFVAAAVEGLRRRRNQARLWPVPALLCLGFLLASLYLAPVIGRRISDALFTKRLDEYSAVVTAFKDGRTSCEIACSGTLQEVRGRSWPGHTVQALGTHCDDGGLMILFLSASDVPLLHQGYLFKEYGSTSDCSRLYGTGEISSSQVPYMRHIAGSWYRFADQPGF